MSINNNMVKVDKSPSPNPKVEQYVRVYNGCLGFLPHIAGYFEIKFYCHF